MKKFIGLEDKLYESYLVIDLDKINDEILPINRKTGGGADKNQFFIQGRYFDTFKIFFPLIYKDREESITGKNKTTIKNFFNIGSLLNELDFINNEIKNKYSREDLIDKDEYFKRIINLSKEQNLNTTIYIESEIANAKNGIAFKEWDKNFKSIIKLILLPTTQVKVYLFRDVDEICAYWEFKQDYIIHSHESDTDTNVLPSTFPLNQILYGPPGTGKTYNAINHALSIIKGNNLAGMSRTQIKKEFDDYMIKGQIQFVTFHQSYSYEEFVEGIKPTVNKKGEVEYHIEDGIFKKLCDKAVGNSILNVGDVFFNSRASSFTISKYNSEVIEITRDEGSVITFPTNLITGLLKLLEDGAITISDIVAREKDGKPLQEFMEIKFDKYIFGYESILKPLLEFIMSKEKERNGNYVLIIDEINRGNISKIFGELITLIECSKRIGANEELRLKLTYSGQKNDEMFGVPNNVYIIGTMNTADRSITNIDTALRRRFVFEEFAPIYNHDLIKTVIRNNEVIDLQKVLKVLNERIEYLLDRDHLIGHSYFINVNDWDTLCDLFRDNIIPLLQEYFYNAWDKIALVLGDNESGYKVEESGKFILKKKYLSENLFGKNNNIEEEFNENQYYINPKLLERNYSELSEQIFIKGFETIT